MGLRFVRLSSSSNLTIYVISAAVEAIALYSASELDMDSVPCFLDFQDMGDCPSMMRYLVMDLLESMHDPQSLSEKA